MPSKSVLIVEDEEAQREALAEFLHWHGFEVLTFASGRDAVDWLTTEAAHLDGAVIDWHLPGVGGQGVIQCIRDRFPSAPVIVASGSPLSSGERRTARWSIALRKPFSMRRVVQLLHELMESSEPSPSDRG